jgi:hypothetical protein
MQGVVLLCALSPSVAAAPSIRCSVERPQPLTRLAGRMRLIVYSARSCFEVLELPFDDVLPGKGREPIVHVAEAVEYLQIHSLYRKSAADRPLFRHMTQFLLFGDYRSDLLDMHEGIADGGPSLIGQDWVQTAVTAINNLTSDGRVTLAKNHGKKLIDPIPFEPIGASSRFLTYQWLCIHSTFTSASRTPGNHHGDKLEGITG